MESKIRYKWAYLQNRNRLTDREKNMVSKIVRLGNLRSKGKQECSRQEIRERPGRRRLLADPGTTWDWALETVKSRPVTGSFGVSSSKHSRNFSRDRLGWATGQGLQEYNLPSDYEALKKLNKVYLDSSRPICPQPHAWRCPIQTHHSHPLP